MPFADSLLLVFCICALVYFVRNDVAEYAAFKLLSATKDRQRTYRAWIVKSFLIFTGTSVIGLWILRRLHSLTSLPPEFNGLAGEFQKATSGSHFSSGFFIGLSVPVAIGAALGAILVKRQRARTSLSSSGASVVVGDIEAMMPRNWPETAHTALLSLNAGLGEELFFRLLLPLLLVSLSGSAIFAFITSALVFGLVHAYQGIVGVLATAVMGCVLTIIYLASGSIQIAIAVHASLDLIGLVVRPSLARLMSQPALPT